jgi:hypothetical protein
VRFVSRVEDIPAGAVLVPWGWCKSVQTWAAQHGCVLGSPALAAVARANSREFSSALEAEWNVGLPGARSIHTPAELDLALSDAAKLPGGWVIKANFGMAARERILARYSAPRAQDVEWARRRIERGEPIVLEPWVESIAEFGCQFSVPPSGRPALEGITGLLTDPQGTYRGSRLTDWSGDSPSNLLEPSVLEVVQRAAQRVQQLGYFGPLGIDVMQYRTAQGEIAWRPLQDLNARLTMGRAALGLRRLLAAGEQAIWLHVRRTDGFVDGGSRLPGHSGSLPPEVRLIRTSPLEAGGRPISHRTVLLIAQSANVLESISARVRSLPEASTTE